MKGNTLYFFVHVPKTAGSTFVKQLTKNFVKDELLEVSPKLFELTENDSGAKYKKAAEKYFSRLSKKQKKKLKVVYGHSLPNGLEKYFDQEVRYITFLRDPSRRVVSLYNFFRMLYENDNKILRLRHKNNLEDQKRIERLLLVNNKIPEFEEWFEEKFKKEKRDYALMSSVDYFDKFGHKNLDKFYFVGLTENYEEDSLFVYHEMSIDKLFASQNKSRKYFDINKNKKIKDEVEKYLSEDYLLYKEGAQKNKKFKNRNKNFGNAVKIMKEKQKMIWVNQVRYDFVETVWLLKGSIFN